MACEFTENLFNEQSFVRGCKNAAKLALGENELEHQTVDRERKQLHGNTYDYSLTTYGAHKKVTLLCQKHGEFKYERAITYTRNKAVVDALNPMHQQKQKSDNQKSKGKC